jgi:hypothetical protein
LIISRNTNGDRWLQRHGIITILLKRRALLENKSGAKIKVSIYKRWITYFAGFRRKT